MIQLYNTFISFHIEWLIYYIIICCGLYLLLHNPLESAEPSFWKYLGFNLLPAPLFYPLVDSIPFYPVFDMQGTAIWIFFILLTLNSIFWLILFFRKKCAEGIAYISFYVVFILVYKTTLSFFYIRGNEFPTGIYAAYDILSIVFLIILLLFMTILFKKSRLCLDIPFLPKAYFLGISYPVIFFIFFILHSAGIPFVWNYTQSILSALLLYTLPLMYYILSAIIREYHAKEQLTRTLAETNTQLIRYRYSMELEDRIRKERHELKNNYFYIQTLVKEQRYEELSQYLSKTIGEKIESISSVFTGNVMIDYILNRKIAEGKQHGIPVYTEIMLPGQVSVNDDIVCTILLNLLDNALEASRKETEPEIQIFIRTTGNYLVFCIKNHVSKDVLKINPACKTTKNDPENHGFGLPIVRSTIQKGNGFFRMHVEDGYFTATAALPMEAGL